MTRNVLAGFSALTVAATAALLAFTTLAAGSHRHEYKPVLNPANLVRNITNPYFPLPVGRTLIYTGIKDGKVQIQDKQGNVWYLGERMAASGPEGGSTGQGPGNPEFATGSRAS